MLQRNTGRLIFGCLFLATQEGWQRFDAMKLSNHFEEAGDCIVTEHGENLGYLIHVKHYRE